MNCLKLPGLWWPYDYKSPVMLFSLSSPVHHLRAPYLKVEDQSRGYKPLVHEPKVWPRPQHNTSPNSCPFDAPKTKREYFYDHCHCCSFFNYLYDAINIAKNNRAYPVVSVNIFLILKRLQIIMIDIATKTCCRLYYLSLSLCYLQPHIVLVLLGVPLIDHAPFIP